MRCTYMAQKNIYSDSMGKKERRKRRDKFDASNKQTNDFSLWLYLGLGDKNEGLQLKLRAPFTF